MNENKTIQPEKDHKGSIGAACKIPRLWSSQWTCKHAGRKCFCADSATMCDSSGAATFWSRPLGCWHQHLKHWKPLELLEAFWITSLKACGNVFTSNKIPTLLWHPLLTMHFHLHMGPSLPPWWSAECPLPKTLATATGKPVIRPALRFKREKAAPALAGPPALCS